VGVNARWPLDFVSDSFGASNKFRILAGIDDYTRGRLCLVADTSLYGARVARELGALIRANGKPGLIFSDNVLCRENLAAWISRSWGIQLSGCPAMVSQTVSAVKKRSLP